MSLFRTATELQLGWHLGTKNGYQSEQFKCQLSINIKNFFKTSIVLNSFFLYCTVETNVYLYR